VAVVKRGQGLVITDDKGKELYSITEANGLCTNSIVYIAYDGHGKLWGSTENGIFSIAIPSAFSFFTRNEGLTEEVLSIAEFNGKKYVGTIDGLFRLEGKKFVNIGLGNHACWQLTVTNEGLKAATSDGIYCITANGAIKQLSAMASSAFLDLGTEILSGEIDGVYAINKATNARNRVCKLEKVTKISKDKNGVIWLQSIYGEVWCKQNDNKGFHPYHASNSDAISTIVPTEDADIVVKAETEKPFPYPLFSYLDPSGVTWLTNNEGKGLYRWKDGKRLHDMDQLLFPVHEEAISTMYVRNGELWLGSDDGLTIINTHWKDPLLEVQPKLVIRSVVLGGDSVLWGGYGEMPEKLANLQYNEDDLDFTYSLNYTSVVGKTLYRYKMDNEKWSPWSTNTHAKFTNIPYHTHTFSVQAMDVMGRQSDVVSIQFYITPPFYRQWYMYLLYFIITAVIIYAFVQLRLRKLQNDKIQLEHVIQERTAEVVKQKDEIEEKSKSLETALRDLEEAQHELIRQEKMATAGKLTQGLIDRILNPMNYINNFSKLSCGLLKDLKANIEDEEEHMDKENYEDTLDVLDMLDQNLQKVEQHGLNTTRTLKAMEEILKDRTGGKISMDLCSILKQDEEMLHNYFKEKISTYHIQVLFSLPETSVTINGNPELLSMTFMSILGNSMYAVEKKAARVQYTPEISVTLKQVDTNVVITIRDTGIGIESNIIDKIFDPFFTTKPTGEAAGIGLYLSHEVIQNHNGSISVESEKDNYTTITITLPILQN
jgi:signal transduction histidine kinase